MKKVTVDGGPLSVNSGQISLTAEQARPRLHALVAVKVDAKGGGVYSVTGPIQFKRGESFGFDGEVGKNGVLRDPEAEQLAQLEAEVAMEKKIAARMQTQFDAAVSKAAEEMIAKLKPETAALVRAELAVPPAK